VLCRVEGQNNEGFLVVLFPYESGGQKPVVEAWSGGAGAKISWKGETHYVILDVREHDVNAGGISARASALVVKQRQGESSLVLLDGTQARFAGMEIKREQAPAAVEMRGRERIMKTARDLFEH